VRKILEIYSTGSRDASSSVTSVQFEEPELYNAGKLIMLFDENSDGDEDEIRGVEVERLIEGFLWGNVKTHPMKVYCELIAGLR
jgi:hypothetical protein